jgi:hypothetical protein
VLQSQVLPEEHVHTREQKKYQREHEDFFCLKYENTDSKGGFTQEKERKGKPSSSNNTIIITFLRLS